MTTERKYTCDICGERFSTAGALGGHVSGHRRRIPDEQLIDELKRLASQLGSPPTATEMDELGAYAVNTYEQHFDSWTNALRAAGYEPKKEFRVSAEEILEEIHRLADGSEKPPTAAEMRSDGKYSITVAHDEFGSWNEALQAAGYDPQFHHRISDEELLQEIHWLVEELEKIPTASEMQEQGQYTHRPYFRRWDSWQTAVRAAGYEPVGRPSGPDNYMWKEEAANEWREYGDNWPQQRQKALERDGYICQTPGCEWTQEAHREAFKGGLHVHHIRPLSTFGADDSEVDFERANRLENLVTVCAEHHHLWERASPLRLDTR